MGWEFLPAVGAFSKYCHAWDELNRRLYNGHPYFDSRFVGLLLKYFARGDEVLCIYHGAKDGDGILLLQPGRYGRWTQFAPSQAQAAPILVSHANMLPELFQDWPGRFMVDFLCQDPKFTPLSDALPILRLDHAQTIGIDLNGEFDAYWRARPKSLIENMRRYGRRAQTDGLLPELRCVTESEQMKEALARYGALESKGWKEKIGTAIHATNRQGGFYRDVLTSFAETGQARVYECWFGNRLIAAELTLNNADMTILMKTTHDESLARYAPGRTLLRLLVEHEFKERFRPRIEFYTNASLDEQAWGTDQRMIQHIMLFSSHPMRASYGFAHRAYVKAQGFLGGMRQALIKTNSSDDGER